MTREDRAGARGEMECGLDDVCLYCLREMARGVPEDGKCGHGHLINTMRKARATQETGSE